MYDFGSCKHFYKYKNAMCEGRVINNFYWQNANTKNKSFIEKIQENKKVSSVLCRLLNYRNIKPNQESSGYF